VRHSHITAERELIIGLMAFLTVVDLVVAPGSGRLKQTQADARRRHEVRIGLEGVPEAADLILAQVAVTHLLAR
jgi:hypothetical protein